MVFFDNILNPCRHSVGVFQDSVLTNARHDIHNLTEHFLGYFIIITFDDTLNYINVQTLKFSYVLFLLDNIVKITAIDSIGNERQERIFHRRRTLIFNAVFFKSLHNALLYCKHNVSFGLDIGRTNAVNGNDFAAVFHRNKFIKQVIGEFLLGEILCNFIIGSTEHGDEGKQ